MDLLISHWKPFGVGFLIGTVAFALYAEYGPGLGHVWIRPNDLGDKVISLQGLTNLMIKPLRSLELWKPQNLDINYFFVAGTSGVAGALLSHFIF